MHGVQKSGHFQQKGHTISHAEVQPRAQSIAGTEHSAHSELVIYRSAAQVFFALDIGRRELPGLHFYMMRSNLLRSF